MHNFKQLRIWQDSIDLVENIYLETKSFPKNEEYGLTSQMRRCSVSVPSNIAEGSGRGSDKDFKRFLSISLSSSFELETQLIIANRLGFVESGNFENSIEKIRKLQKMIFSFRKKLSTIVKLRSFMLSLFV